MESMNLIALADEQLDLVAGGCGGRKGGGEYGYDSRKQYASVTNNVDVDVDTVTVIFKDNEIKADGDVTINIFAEA